MKYLLHQCKTVISQFAEKCILRPTWNHYSERYIVFNTMYLRNPRNVTGVMSQILVILLPVTSYQPKTMPDKQWKWLEGSFWSWRYASFWGFSGVKNWKLAILCIIRVGSWWFWMGMNSVNINSCKHDKKLGLCRCNRVKRVKIPHFWRPMFSGNLRTSAPGVVL